MSSGWISALGLLLVVGATLAYLGMLFVLHRFTYRTWIFHAATVAGMGLAVVALGRGGGTAVPVITLILGTFWFVATGRELRLPGSKELLAVGGKPLPRFSGSDVTGRPLNEQDIIAAAPALLILYRGWWCPSSKVQLDELLNERDRLKSAGLTLFAASVDGSDEAYPMQEHVGDSMTILCGIPESFLDEVGVRDSRGAPWYDRWLFGAPKRSIAMPTALIIDSGGHFAFAYRATRVDDRATPNRILTSFLADRDTYIN